jgi:inosine-uridine nucleoside N-ribohydrolase
VRIVFDTDMGNDIDDALALAILHALASRGECELIAVTLTKDNRYSAPFVDIVDTFYGRGEVPVGVCRSGVTPEDGSYTKAVVEAADADRPRYARTQSDFPDAVTVLRRALVGVPDHSAAAVQVGFSTNLANLLASQPDAISPLSGMDLVRSKVRLLSIMAGTFSGRPEDADFGEYNVVGDLPATHRLIEQWPTEIVISGFEVGNALLYPARSIERDFAYVAHHPIPEAYAAYMKMPYDRPTWDLTAALYAVRPDAGYFDLSVPGRIAVNDQGHTSFTEDPAGHHRYLKIPPGGSARILEAMQLLASQPPGG